jgi:sorting nexin-29
VEPFTENISQEEVNVAVTGLKNWKVPGSDNIPAELMKFGGNNLQKVSFRLCDKMRQMPTSWYKAVIIPLHKKGDKMECDNYRSISLLNTAYKIFSKILLKRLMSYVDENIDNFSNTHQYNYLYIICIVVYFKFKA